MSGSEPSDSIRVVQLDFALHVHLELAKEAILIPQRPDLTMFVTGCECTTYTNGQTEISTECDNPYNVKYNYCYW